MVRYFAALFLHPKEVSTYYHGKKRYIGSFPSLETGLLASKAARDKLQARDGPKPSDEEIVEHIQLAKKAALVAASIPPTVANDAQSHTTIRDTSLNKSTQMNNEVTQEATIDYTTVGVRQTKSGKWEVGFRYHGKRRNLGTFDTQDHAALANKIGRRFLRNISNLNANQADENVKLARKTALDAVHKIKGEDDTLPSEEEVINTLMMSNAVDMEVAGSRSKLLTSRLQPEKVGLVI